MAKTTIQTLQGTSDMAMRTMLSAILASISICIWAGCNRPVAAPKAQTEARLKNAYHTMQLAEDEGRLPILEQLQRITNQTNLQAKWVQLMIATAAQSGIDSNTALDTICRDGYGRFLNVELRTNLISRKASPNLTNLSSSIVLWSSGMNGLNEWGFGDDICLLISDK